VKEWDEETGTGAVLLDDGTELKFDSGSLDPRMLTLRFGQRVSFDVDDRSSDTSKSVRNLMVVTLS
jgi:cold shock CspA family protein